MNQRPVFFEQCNAQTAHQRLAGIASWMAFSARWRARQGLPLLHPMDVQYLTPQDFRTGSGHPLSPTVQRRLFRQYVEQALALQPPVRPYTRVPLVSDDLAHIRSTGFVRSGAWHPDFVFGREGARFYDPEMLRPTRPYGIPLTSRTVSTYWLAVSPDDEDNGDESWMDDVEPGGDEEGADAWAWNG